jgi:hypothetical protein
LAKQGELIHTRTSSEDIDAILKGDANAMDFNRNEFNHNNELDEFLSQFTEVGLFVIDDGGERVFVGKTKKYALMLKNAETSYELGKMYGYSDEDIATFYLRRGWDDDISERKWNSDKQLYNRKTLE